MLLNSRQFKFLKNCRNVNVKSSANREYRDENVFLKGAMRMCERIVTFPAKRREIRTFRIFYIIISRIIKYFLFLYIILQLFKQLSLV